MAIEESTNGNNRTQNRKSGVDPLEQLVLHDAVLAME